MYICIFRAWFATVVAYAYTLCPTVHHVVYLGLDMYVCMYALFLLVSLLRHSCLYCFLCSHVVYKNAQMLNIHSISESFLFTKVLS
jgi:hypothetical protein